MWLNLLNEISENLVWRRSNRSPVNFSTEILLQIFNERISFNCGLRICLLLRARKHEYTLAQLLEQITPENIQGETDWGAPAGGEAW